MRVAHADIMHVVDRIADVLDARPAHSDSLRHQPGAAMQVQLAHVGGVRRIGDEGKRAHLPARCELHRDEAGLVYAARHFPIPKARERAAQSARVNAVSHSPARAAAAQAHDEPGLALGAAVACRQDAQGTVVAVRPAWRPVLVVEAGRPHERAIAEYPEVALGKQRAELADPHGRGL